MWDDCCEGKSVLTPESISKLCLSISHVFTNWLESLPQELIPDILVNLPVKSLVRFTSVSKSWNSTIKDPTFIRTHLTHNLKSSNDQNATHLLLLHNVSDEGTSEPYGVIPNSGFKEEYYSLHCDDNSFTEHCKIAFPIALKELIMMRNPCFRVVGSCNGVVLLADDMCRARDCYNFVLWNPSIRKCVILPKPTVRLSTHGEFQASFGLGYDAIKNEYKVVRVIFVEDPLDHHLKTLVQYFSLATGSWGMLRVLPPCVLLNSKALVLVNGALHCLVLRGIEDCVMLMVMGFDVGSESLREMLLPESLKADDGLELHLSASGDRKSIALFARCKTNTNCYLDIWVMKEYLVQKSWTKLMILTPQGPERSLPYAKCFRRNGEVVLMLEDDRKLVSLDIVSKQFKSLGISAGLVWSVDSYEESLVLLDRKDAISY